MRLSRCGWTLLGTVTFGLAVLTSCNKVDTDDLAKKIAKELRDGDKPYHPVAVGDDQPIIIAGGSMSFVAPVGYKLKRHPSSQTLLFVNAGGSAPNDHELRRVDVIDADNNMTLTDIASGSNPKIKITYDQEKGGGPPEAEDVTITAPQGNNIAIQSSLIDIRTSKDHSPRFWSHPKKHKLISQIQVNTDVPIPCLKDGQYGECSVVIHYCKVGTTCDFQ